MAFSIYTAKDGTYEEFCAGYDPATMPFDVTAGGLGFLGKAVVNEDPRARLAIANRLLDDGADPSLVSTDGDRINVLHALWGREQVRDPEAEAALIARLLDGGADINLRSPRFGLPLTMLLTDISASHEYLRAAFAAVTAHSRPDLTAHVDRRRQASVGQYLADNMFGFMRDEVRAYAAATGQDIDVIS
ncbi:ankyrin repeat protein [Rathayibacter agropyri]